MKDFETRDPTQCPGSLKLPVWRGAWNLERETLPLKQRLRREDPNSIFWGWGGGWGGIEEKVEHSPGIKETQI